MLWQPDITAEIELYPTEAGGRTRPLRSSSVHYFGCPIAFEGQMFDARFDLSEVGVEIAPGHTAKLNAKFLWPELIKPRLKVGDRFLLWEGKFIGKGRVLSIHDTLNSLLGPDAQVRGST
jgi:hypothetical protein